MAPAAAMSWCRLSRLLKPALLCGALAAPGLAGTMVGTPETWGDGGHSGRVGDLVGTGSGVGFPCPGWRPGVVLARLGGPPVGRRTPGGSPRAEGGQALAGEVPWGWEPVSGSP